jgi:hypothetical protein
MKLYSKGSDESGSCISRRWEGMDESGRLYILAKVAMKVEDAELEDGKE